MQHGERNQILRNQILNGSNIENKKTQIKRDNENVADRLALSGRRRIDAGDIRGAVRIFINDGRITEANDESTAIMSSKHPVGKPVALNPHNSPPLAASKEYITRAITTMPAGGAPGPDGLRPSHLKQLVGPNAGESRTSAIQALENFISVCLAGNIPLNIRPLLFGVSFCALSKKDGGLLPIAVGLVLRRFWSLVPAASQSESEPYNNCFHLFN